MSDDRIERLRRDIVAEKAEVDRLHREADRRHDAISDMFTDLAWMIPAGMVVGVCIGAVMEFVRWYSR